MLTLLNAFNPSQAVFWLIVVLGILLIIELAVFAIFFVRSRLRQSENREIVGLTLVTDDVKRRYQVGEEFDKSGLIVIAHYSTEPYSAQVIDYDLLAPEMTKEGNLVVTVTYRGQVATYLIAVGTEGGIVVPAQDTIDYEITVVAPEELSSLQVALYNGGKQVGEAVNVVDGKATVAAPAGEYIVKVYGLPDDDYEASAELLSDEKRTATVTVTYCEDYFEDVEKVDYEITVVAPEELTSLQVALFNGGVQVGQARNVQDGKATVAAPAGNYIVKVFGLPDDDYEVTAELLSETVRKTTVTIDYCEDYYKLDDREEEVEKSAVEPVQTVCEVVEEEPELTEYSIIVQAPEGLLALQVALYNGDAQIGAAVHVESGAATIKAKEGEYTVKLFGLPEGYEVSSGTVSASRHICTVTVTEIAQEAAVEELAVAAEPAAPIIIEEESFEGGILRYDRSFTARLIQSDNEVKNWYTDIKNELLSYKKVHDRMSWKRESYNCGRLPFARLSFRGETLCIYLPLNPTDFAESKYKVEDVSENSSYMDTPCLYRIKNNRRAKYALELIAMVAENLGVPGIERETQDYYVPYEGLVELINKGLIKRNIKNKSAEAFFVEKKD